MPEGIHFRWGTRRKKPELDGHNLQKLWKLCEQIIKERRLPITADDRQIIKSGVNDFNRVDSQSYAFRYPVNKQGDDSLPDRENPISITGLKGNMHELVDCLERMIDLLAIDSDIRREFNEI